MPAIQRSSFFLGKSGSGKTTLLNLLGGLDRPTDGEIMIGGRSLASYSEKEMDAYRNTCVGFVFQERNLLEGLTVEENLALALRMQQDEVTKEKIAKALELVELSGYEKRRCKELSGGQRQRVAIATHDREAAMTYGDGIIELQDGRVIQDTTNEVVKEEENITFCSAGLTFASSFRIAWETIQKQKYGLHCHAFLADGMLDNLATSYPNVVSTEGMNVQLTYQDVTVPIRHIGRYSDYSKAQETAKIPWENYRDATGEAGSRRKLSDDEFIFPVVYKEQEQSRDMQSWYSLSELYPQEGSNRLDAYGDFSVEITNAEGQMIHTNKTFKMFGCMNISPVDYCGYRDTMLVSDAFFEMICKERAGRYTFAVGNVPQDKDVL